jgi:hypothetical protein
VVLWQVLGDGKTFLIAEEQSMAVFPTLHLVAGTDPGAAFDLFGFVFVVVAGAEGAAEVVDVLGQADDEELGDVFLRVEEGPALLVVVVDELPHLGERLLGRLVTVFVPHAIDIRHRVLRSASQSSLR